MENLYFSPIYQNTLLDKYFYSLKMEGIRWNDQIFNFFLAMDFQNLYNICIYIHLKWLLKCLSTNLKEIDHK